MERVKVFNLITTALTFLALVPIMESQIIRPPITPRPLCASQFALANYACSMLPFNPRPPPSPPTPPPSPPSPTPPDDEGHRHGHGHGHRHGHRHRHKHRQTPEEDNCCRWAKEVDGQCVCEILVHLPPFLVKPLHQYSVTVGELCNVTYSCGGPV